ncbi:type 1 glutamine amidotransferase domain-containing protein [Vibrio splendidus]|uniref:Type 1 glutamine amidotransferase domain-containing protein n=1 Tax=Vibrio splendidus TaxID=29497 RepID=A0ABD5AF57_VIBSP|nr:type 1 glutamine amidotransferase domain-containing protein [Vibrio splendidus]MCC4790081.1 type 1 glutamine amidotransferase domain-containing protein [Vibrio splendidus]MCC4862101.1 type 1 glutamine amidotransferase domain-containing protein [Vibrio splendidus]MDP2490951.1 type 1 glutamine amidotransferase domain-containing protein [Vibrio splendidus]OED72645.1 thiamine biosynthesis protein ThiJ [Vibrio splendidus ZF-90]OEF20507.1 thiamine biosynthesis protein ThiJ [Vibrio splendidus 5S-1
MKKILIPVTNHATLGDTDQANGTYAPELTHALKEIIAAGFEYDIASIKGGKGPLYGTDIEGDSVNAEILADDDFQNRINNTIPVSQINVESYDAIFYPGGFGLLSDLATDEQFAAIAAKHYEDGGVIASVCHGPAALLPIVLSNGEKLLSSKSVTGFTREEEIDFGTINDIPFLLEESLARSAARFNKVQPWQELVIVDERVITGQNPTSAHAVGATLVKQLS